MANNHDDIQRRKAGLTPARKALLEERLQKARSFSKKPASIPARVRSNFAPLSFAQEGLWVLSQFDLQSGLVNRPVILRFRGRLDVPALNGSLQALLQRHESLRCRFRSDLGQPLQQMEAAVKLDLGMIDLTSLEGGDRERQAHEFIRAEISKPVNLARSPLVRANLIRLSQDDHILSMVFHHITFDAWSERVLLADLGAFYEAYTMGKPAALEPLPVQYADIAAWQRERVNGDALAGQLDYWKQKLADLPAATELPTDHPRPVISSDQGEAVDFILPEDLLGDLNEIAQSEGATQSMVLLSAFMVLLSRYTRQTQIVIGLPVAGRTLLESEALVGLFINTLVLRCNLPANPTFREVLRLVRQESLEATSNQEIPLEKLVDVVPVKRDLSRTPFFQILFNFENLPSHRLNFPGLEIEFVASHKEFVRYDLSLELANSGRTLEGSFVYNCDLYEKATIERLVESYKALLADISSAPDRPVAELNLLGVESREVILSAWNLSEVVHPLVTSLQQAFSSQAARTPQKIAIKAKDRSLTYAELEDRSGRLAAYLLQSGVPPQALVGIYMDSSPEMITSMLAALKIGAAFLILDPLQPETRLAAQIDAGQVAWILSVSRHAGGIAERRGRTILIDDDLPQISGLEPVGTEDSSRLDELAYVIFTSGSTGYPKGVMVPQRALLNHTSWARRAFQLEGSDIILQATSLSFDPFLAEIFDSLLSGSTLVLVEPGKQRDPAGLIDLIVKNGVTLIDLTPSFLKLLVENPRFQNCSSLRHVRCGGEVLPVGLVVSFRRQSGAVLHNLYGPAEACIDATHYVCGDLDPGSPVPAGIPIGRAIGGMRTYILDAFFQPVPVGVTGDLYLSGEGLARGYLNQPEWTAEHFLPHPFIAGERIYRTGDQASYLADGNIRFTGREDRQVKLRGVRIELGEIESVLLSHPKISQSVVEVYTTEAEGEHQLVAYVVTSGGAALDLSELQTYLQMRLPKMMIPGKIMVLDGLPLLPGGKIDRSALPPPSWTHPRSQASNLPSTDLEKLVAGVWTEVIQVPNINLSSNFFEIGGHSLLAIRVMARLNDLLGIEVPFNILYEAPRLVDFTRRLAVERGEDSGLESRSEVILRLLEAPEPVEPQKRRESVEKPPQPGAIAAKLLESGSTLEFILSLRKRQVHVWVEGDKLKYSAPPGTITPALHAELRLRKDELIAFLLKASLPDRIEKINSQDRIPLSFAQQRLFIVQQLDPKSFAYNLALSYRIRGDLRVELLEQAVLEVVRRHSALRTNFRLVDGSAVQVIRSEPEIPFLKLDLSHVEPADRGPQLSKQLEENFRKPFDLTEDPLLRVMLVRCAADEFALQIVFHHAVTDLWSLSIFNQEVSTIYRDLAAGQAILLPELPIQYVDYALWQRSWLSGERMAQQLAYWTEQLKPPHPILNLPLDFPRPAKLSHEGARVEFAVGSELRRKLAGLCFESHATMFMLLMSAFDVLIYRYSGQADIWLGVPIANRARVEFENLIGFFVNTLVLRADLSGVPRFTEVLQRVRRLSLDAFANQDMPFEKLVQVLNPPRLSSHTPLFQAGYTYHNTPPSSFELVGVDIDTIPLERGVSRFDITLFIADQGDKLSGSLEFSTELFTPRRARRMVRHFTNLLRQICEAPDTPIDRLGFLSEEEIRQTLTGWNEDPRAFAPAICLHQLFEAQVRSGPDRTALIYPQVQGGEWQPSLLAGEERLSYDELNARANQAARRLRELGVERNSLVGLCMERSLDLLVGLLGILKAGGAYVPIEPDVPCERLDMILKDCGLKLVVAHSTTERRFTDFPVQVVSMDGEAGSLAQLEATNFSIGVSPEDPAYVIYTSGSTGVPKGVVVSHYNVVRLFQSTQEIFDFGDNDVWSLFHSHAFDFSVWEIWGALLHGGKLVVVPYWTSRDPAAFSRLIAVQGVTILNQTPSAFYPLLEIPEFLDPAITPSLRWVIFGGETLSLPMLKPWFARRPGSGTRLVNMYGITETTVHVTFRLIEPADCEHSQSVIGRPLPDLQLYLLDEALEPVPYGIPGEIFVGGAGLALGYLGRPGLSAERFIPDPFGEDPGSRLYRSGDLARRVEGGDLEYLGRRDSQVKIRGFRIELGEIEAALSDFPGVRQVAVSLWKPEQDDGSRLGERLVAHIAAAGEPDSVEMRRFLTTRLPEYMIPATFVFLPSLPLTVNGKIDRKTLPAPERHLGKGGSGFSAHGSVLENLLTRLWSEILQVDSVGPLDDFFDLGGHSLLAINLTNRLNSVFYLDLDARMLFEEPTPEGFARRLRRDAADPDRLDQIASLILEVTDLPGDQDTSVTGT